MNDIDAVQTNPDILMDNADKLVSKIPERRNLLEEEVIHSKSVTEEDNNSKNLGNDVGPAKEKASAETSKMIQNAKEAIRSEQASAVSDMKKQMAKLSVDIAEKILVEKLGNDKAQKDLVNKLMDDIDLN